MDRFCWAALTVAAALAASTDLREGEFTGSDAAAAIVAPAHIGSFRKEVYDQKLSKLKQMAARARRPSLRHRRDSCPSHDDVGGLIFDFEAVLTAFGDRDSRRQLWKINGKISRATPLD